MKEKIAETVKFHRQKSGLSQLELAKLAGIGKTAVFDVEKGVKDYRVETLFKVLDVLNIRIILKSPINPEKDISNAES